MTLDTAKRATEARADIWRGLFRFMPGPTQQPLNRLVLSAFEAGALFAATGYLRTLLDCVFAVERTRRGTGRLITGGCEPIYGRARFLARVPGDSTAANPLGWAAARSFPATRWVFYTGYG